MRLLLVVLSGMLGALVGLSPAAAQEPAPAAPAGPRTVELVEDLRILSILNVLQPTRDQSTRLAALAVAGKEGLAAIDAEAKVKLDLQRDRLLAAREKLLRGEATPPATDEQLGLASRAAQATRAQKTEALIVTLAGRVRRLLTPVQAARIEEDLAPVGEQPWRGYGRVLTGAAAPPRSGVRLPADPGKWLKELRDLRIDSAEGDPAHEIQDFGKKLTRGLPAGTPLSEQSAAQARAFASQVLAMPANVFSQREWDLARMAAKQELSTRNQQRVLDGKPIETFDAARWLVEEVLLSPRAAADLQDRVAGP
jgi:hypothetical protein